MDFKEGDTVVCINNCGVSNVLTVGEEYKVMKTPVILDDHIIAENDQGVPNTFATYRFRKVTHPELGLTKPRIHVLKHLSISNSCRIELGEANTVEDLQSQMEYCLNDPKSIEQTLNRKEIRLLLDNLKRLRGLENKEQEERKYNILLPKPKEGFGYVLIADRSVFTNKEHLIDLIQSKLYADSQHYFEEGLGFYLSPEETKKLLDILKK